MKKNKPVNLIMVVSGCIALIILSLLAIYIKNINFAGAFHITSNDTSTYIVTTTTLGRQQIQGQNFYGYFMEINIFNATKPDKITQNFLNNEHVLALIPQDVAGSYVKPSGFTYYQKIQAFFIISKRDIIFILFLTFMLCAAAYIVLFTGNFLWKSRVRIKNHFLQTSKDIALFIKKYHYKIAVPVLISLIPGACYLIFDLAVTTFMDTGLIPLILVSAFIVVIPIFLIVFHKPLKINLKFWLAFLIVFILYFFILFPDIYIYGNYFRDDISKFFVKAFGTDLLGLLTTPDANYLNTYQSLIPYTILKIFGIRQYFPEALQIMVLLSLGFIYASFNLKIFREICKSDRLRFAISIVSSLIVILFGRTLLMYEVPFLAALLFWPVLFLKADKLSNITWGIMVLFFVVFILSKPIFVVHTPLMFIILAYAISSKQKKLFWGMAALLFAILLQFAVNYFNNQNILNYTNPDGFGTNVNSAFRQDDMAFPAVIEFGLYVFIRTFVRLIFPYVQEPGNCNIYINIAAFIIIIVVNVWFLIQYKKSKRKEYLFMLSGCAVALFACFLFVKTISLRNLQAEQGSILNFDFLQLLQSEYLPNPHRYLLLANFALATALVYFIIINIKRHVKISEMWLVLVFSAYFLIIGVRPFYNYVSSNKRPAHSLWRQYSGLIFQYPEKYYIPYYGYPRQSESIRHGIDRITDVTTSEKGIINLDSLPYNTQKWKIIELVTEYQNEKSDKIFGVEAITKQNDTLFQRPFNPVSSEYRFIIFRFNELYNLKVIKFVDKDKNTLKLQKTIRLVGSYE